MKQAMTNTFSAADMALSIIIDSLRRPLAGIVCFLRGEEEMQCI